MENLMSPENIQVLAGYGPIILMALVFYFLLWRPQKKQQQQRNEMLASLKKGDRVITTGGIFGTINVITPKTITLKIAERVEIEVLRSAIHGLQNADEK
ncbi:preprotein translocase subunit YajC [Azotosporobacter soli]|jgi:preprotein translocase subunit YajC|uniref:preprotein translocase subunit YajC n=1 Tax=Azotosporobacter soli TaxID=3055040 RepID=UPI0031FF2159